MGYYADNPWERPETPRCGECDEQMEQVRVPFGPDDWRCTNPDCPNCPDAIGAAVACAYGTHNLLLDTEGNRDVTA